MEHSPWHKGETQIQAALGITERMAKMGQLLIRDFMPDEHREFFTQLEFIVLSALDETGRVWPFIWSGQVGFITSPDPTHLVIERGPLSGQPEGLLLQVGDKISLLGIVPETKRRNRMNGTILRADSQKIKVKVDQSYGNCPKYIHVRAKGRHTKAGPVQDRTILNEEDKTHITAADTLFIASRAPQLGTDPRHGIDVNHRGGLPGFVKLLDDNTVIIPDYAGNNFFNTFGNILQDPRTGLMIPNFETGDILTLNGQAKVVLEDHESSEKFGSHRYIIFTPDKIRRADSAFPFIHALTEYSKNPPQPQK